MYLNFSPLDQFEIKSLLNLSLLQSINLSFTNMSFNLLIVAFIVLTLHLINDNFQKVLCNNSSASQESIYATIYSIVINQINQGRGQMFFPFMYTLFAFILTNNLVGMVPYSFASTSHFILTFSLSFTIVIGATILGFAIHTFKFFSLLVPSGCPLALLPLLVLIEFISYLARNISLGLRLAANIKNWD